MEQEYPQKWMNQPIKKVALIGGASSRKQAPIDDPSWQIWGLGPRQLKLPRVDRWFEMHSKEQLIDYYDVIRGGYFDKHWTFLRSMKKPIYMIRVYEGLPNSVAYPIKDVMKDVGRCFTSSVAYMIGLAIHEKFQGIGLWGINMASKKEYKHQWPGVQYLLALARQRGIQVYLPDDCPITIPKQPKLVVTKVLYGYDWNHPEAWWNQPERKAQLEKVRKKAEKKAKRKRSIQSRKKLKQKLKKLKAKLRRKSPSTRR